MAVRCVTFLLSTVKFCVVFTRGSVHKHRNKRRRRDDDDGRLFVRSRRNPKEKGATMASCLVCVKGYKGERRKVPGVRSQRAKGGRCRSQRREEGEGAVIKGARRRRRRQSKEGGRCRCERYRSKSSRRREGRRGSCSRRRCSCHFWLPTGAMVGLWLPTGAIGYCELQEIESDYSAECSFEDQNATLSDAPF